MYTKTLLLTACSFLCTIVFSQQTTNFHLLKDIDSLKESNPQNQLSNVTPNRYAVFNGVAYFQANDGIHGGELWRSDGTAGGTYMVKDISAGKKSSVIRDLVVSGNKLFFVTGSRLWITDGTSNGTRLLDSTETMSNPQKLTDVNGTLFFFVTPQYAPRLCKSDGTVAGTGLVRDLHRDDVVDYGSPVSCGGKLFFSARNYYMGWQLYKSDGTADHTGVIRNFKNLCQLTSYAGNLYFSADDGTGYKLWVTNVTTKATTLVPGNNKVILQPIHISTASDLPFTINNGILYLQGKLSSTGFELYKYDSSNTDGVVLVKDIEPGTKNALIKFDNMVSMNNWLYFYRVNSNGNYELWQSNGSAENTILVKQFDAGATISNLVPGNNLVYFDVNDLTYGQELWMSDGNSENTVLVKDIYPGNVSSSPAYITFNGSEILFSACNKGKGTELWKSKGTASTTEIVKDINITSSTSSNAGYNIAALNDKVIFSAFDKPTGNELYVSDGTGKGTVLIDDIKPGEAGSNPYNFFTKNGFVYFIATLADTVKAIYRTAGTAASTQLMASVTNGDIESMDVADNGLVFYIVYSAELSRVALWRSDGTAQGTYAVCNDAGFRMRTAGNNAYFPGFDKVHGTELWKSDGTVAGTVMVKNILPGAEGSVPYPLYSWKSKIYFEVVTVGGSGFWKSDGTAGGTIKLGDMSPSADLFAFSNDRLYFVAEFPGYGTELGKTDGTAKGTKLVKDIFEGTSGSSPSHLVYMNGAIYFDAKDKTHGDELWKSDGSTAGTKLLEDLTPGSGSSFFSDICPVNNKLFISANTHIWISDGSNTGASLINDPLLNKIDYKRNLIAAGNSLFLNGTTPEYGYELYTASALAYDSANKAVTQTLRALATQNFEARILENPIQNTLSIVTVSPVNQDIHLQVLNVSGQTFITKCKTVYKGSNNITYNTVSWPHGIYFLKIITHDNNIITLKFSK